MTTPNTFANLCKYYLDCLLEDDTETKSVSVSGRLLDYVEIGQPELTHRNNPILSKSEKEEFGSLNIRMTRGNQKRAWLYGYPNLLKWKGGNYNQSKSILEPLFIVPLEINDDKTISFINTSAIRLNICAFKDLDVEPQEAQQIAANIGLYDDNISDFSLFVLAEKLRKLYPHLQWIDSMPSRPFSRNMIKDEGIYLKGIIYSKESSPYTQGLERELERLVNLTTPQISQSSLSELLNVSTKAAMPNPSSKDDLIEVFPLNEAQREAVQASLQNKLVVITGPPGTGKSQVVASIIINAALRGKRVLFASKNHKAVDVVEERVNGLVNRPFLIRLGRRGSGNRNIEQELIQYLNSLLGVTGQPGISDFLDATKKKMDTLLKARRKILNKLEHYRVLRSSVNKAEQHWLDISSQTDKDKALRILEWAKGKAKIKSFSLWTLFSKKRKAAFLYSKMLFGLEREEDVERLTEELYGINQKFFNASQEYFKLWVDSTPNRLQSSNRQSISDYVSIIQQMIGLDDITPKNIWAKLYQQKDELISKLSGFLPAWCVVNLSVRGQLPLLEGFFDIVVIDEASQCDIPSAIPLLYRGKQAVIIGDTNQLQHITTMRTGRSVELMQRHNLSDTSLASFEYTGNSLYRLAASRVNNISIIMLDECFRSHADIVKFSNDYWYHGSLSVGTDYRKLNPPIDEDELTVKWIETDGPIVQLSGSSAMISTEVNKVVSVVLHIIKEQKFDGEIGIVTPFRFQANTIREKLETKLSDDDFVRTQLLVDTAVRFQGDERDIIIFSPVVAKSIPQGARYYLENTPNLFNVAITRARSRLIVVGNKSACLNCGIAHISAFAKYVNYLAEGAKKRTKMNRCETEYEEILFSALKENGIVALPQYIVGQDRLDFAIFNNNLKLDVEVDGVTTHIEYTGERVKQDIKRNLRLQNQVWKVLRFWNYEIRDNLDYCIKQIKDQLVLY